MSVGGRPQEAHQLWFSTPPSSTGRRGLVRNTRRQVDVSMDPFTYSVYLAIKTEGGRLGRGGKRRLLDGCFDRLTERIATGEITVEEVHISGKRGEGQHRRGRFFLREVALAALADLGLRWTEFVRCALRLYHDDSERRELEAKFFAAGGVGDVRRYSDDFLHLFAKHSEDNDPQLGRWLRTQRILEDRVARLEGLTEELLRRVLPLAMDKWLETYGNRIPTESEIRAASIWELRVMLEAAELERRGTREIGTEEMREQLLKFYYGVRLQQLERTYKQLESNDE